MTVFDIDAPAGRKLPIWQTAKGAYADTVGNAGACVIAAAVPFVMSVVLDAATAYIGQDRWMYWLSMIAGYVITSLFELAWLRFLLMGPARGRPRLLPGSARRLLTFQVYSLALLAFYGPALLLYQVTQNGAGSTPAGLIITMVALYVLAVYLQIRLCFAGLWIATDGAGRFAASWRATAGNGVHLVVTLLAISLPLLLVIGAAVAIITAIAHGGGFQPGRPRIGQEETSWLAIGIGNLLLYGYNALACAVLARAFRALTGWQGDQRELLERFD